MNNPQVGGIGTVTAPELLPAKASLPNGDYTVTVKSITQDGDSEYVSCLYPDGFVKDHEVTTVDGLLTKITNQLRGRFGPMTVTFKTLPPAIAEGAQVALEITNG